MSLEGRIYQFRLTKVELAELALRLTWDSFMLGKMRYLLITAGILLITPALGGILAIGAGLTTALLSLPFFLFQALQNLTIFFLALTVLKFLSYFWTFSRQPVSQEMRLRLENGCLYEDKVSVVHQGSSFTAFPETPGLLLLKRELSRKSHSYLVLPKRVFSGPDEIQAFKAYLNTPSPYNQPHTQSPDSGSCRFRFTFQLSPDDFAHVYTELMGLFRCHQPLWRNGSALLSLFFCPALSLIMATRFIVSGDVIASLGIFGLGLFLSVFLLFSVSSIREDVYRRRMRQNRFPINGSGPWDLSFSPEMLTVRREQDSFQRSWDAYTQFYETADTLFLLCIENQVIKQYVFIPKWTFACREEQDAFTAFCQSRGKVLEFVHIPEIEEPERIQKKARRRNILFWLALSLYLVLLIVVSILTGLHQSGL